MNRVTLRCLVAGLISALLFVTAGSAGAASYYWDTDGATPGAGGATPSNTWSTGGTTWSTSPNGTVATPATTTAATDDLVFSAGINATGSYTITLNDSQSAQSLTFQDGTATISGTGGIINLGGTGVINVPNSITASPLSAVIGANTDTLIAGSAGLTKVGVGTLTLNGTAVNTVTGGLKVNGGTLALDFANLTTPTDLINSGNALSFGGGSLSITGQSSGTTSQTFGDVIVNSGGGSLLVNPNNGTATNITLGSLNTTASGGSFVVGQATSSGAGTLTITTTTDKDATGIYGGRVVFANGTANTGYDWATTATASPFTLSAYTGYTAMASSGTDTNNSVITAGASLAGNLTTNSLKFEVSAAAQTLAIGAGNTLTLTSGGLLMTGSSNDMNITGGSITAGDGLGPADLVVHQFNPAQQLGIGVTGTNLNNTPEIASNIVNNNSQPLTLVKNGPGSIRFTGTNTFTGGIIVNQGSVDFGTNALNNNAMTFNANSFFYTNGAHTTSGSITLNNGCQVTICNNNSSFTVNANVLGNGGISVANGGQGAITVNLNGTGNTFTGPIRFTANNGTQQATLNVNSLQDTDTLGTGNITFGAGTASSISHNFGLGSGAVAPLTLNNRRFEMAENEVNQQINNSSTQPLTINTDMLVTGTRAKNLQLGGTGAGISTFAGAIGDIPNPVANGTVPNAVRKTANGNTLTLASVMGIAVGDTITGSILPAGTTITAVDPLNRVVTLSTTYTGGNNSNFNVGVIFTVGAVVNSVSVTKAGTGTWVLSGNNTYTGPTNITAGVLNIQNANALGATTTGTLVASNATLQLQGGISYASEPLTLTNNTTNTAILQSVSGNNTWNGTITTSGNTASSFVRIQADADTLTLAGIIDTATNNNGSVVLQGAAPAINVTGQIIGSGGVISGSVGAGPTTIRTVNNDTNSFTGRAQVSGGVLAFTSVADAGTVSALGAGTVTSTIGLASGTNNATLRYIGTDPLGHTTTRDINLGSGTAGNHTATIEANGTGPLVLGSVSSNTTGTKSLVLTGTNTGGNSIGAITSGSATAVSLTKDGAGAWTLSGANTYTGATNVQAGTLKVTGSGSIQSIQPINVSASATLRLESSTSPALGLGGGGVDITNNGTFEVASTQAVGDISGGTGSKTTVFGTATSLTANSIVQDALEIGAGCSVTIREAAVPPGAAGVVQAVPEPGTWALIATALVGLLALRRRR
jgi:autotransporter-associated beta strand protein